MEDAHVTWVRQFVYWSEVETDKDQFDWKATDQVFDAFKLYPDLKPIIVFMSTPRGRSAENTDANTPPTNNEDFARFAAAFAGRYGEWVDYYQIWDEPNLTAAWGGQETACY